MGAKVTRRNTRLAFGSWLSRTTDTVYQAATDGWVCAYNTGYNDGALEGFTDGSDPPTTKRVGDRGGQAADTYLASISMPVRSGDYWKVTNADTVWWLPLNVIID